MIKAKIRDKAKQQKKRPTELAAYDAVIAEAKEEDLSLSDYIRRCRFANAQIPTISVFFHPIGVPSRYERKKQRSFYVGMPLFSVEFSRMGMEE